MSALLREVVAVALLSGKLKVHILFCLVKSGFYWTDPRRRNNLKDKRHEEEGSWGKPLGLWVVANT